MLQLQANSTLRASSSQVSCDVGGEAVILEVEGGVYYGVEGVGARIWELVQEPRSLEEIRRTLLAEYDVAPDQCERELQAFLDSMLTSRLIEIQNDDHR